MSAEDLTPAQRLERARSFDDMVASHWSLVSSVRRFSMLVVAALALNTAVLIYVTVLAFRESANHARVDARLERLESKVFGSH